MTEPRRRRPLTPEQVQEKAERRADALVRVAIARISSGTGLPPYRIAAVSGRLLAERD